MYLPMILNSSPIRPSGVQFTSPMRPPGRTTGRTRVHYNLSVAIDVRDWLRNHPDGPAAVADRVFRKEMERERRKS